MPAGRNGSHDHDWTAIRDMQHELYHGDCLKVIPHLGLFNMAFADPPDNIGLGYNEFCDSRADDEYLAWLRQCILRLISVAPILWLSFNARWTVLLADVVADMVRETGIEVKPCVQVFTFGQNQRDDLGNGHRPLWRFMRPGTPLFPDQAREPSWRLLNGDKRADPRGAVPLDVFDFPRVTGNSKQRRSWHPTQLNESLVERCIKLCTREGGKVLDPFGGTGTTLRVCQRLNRSCTLIEYDSLYCEKIAAEHSIPISKISAERGSCGL